MEQKKYEVSICLARMYGVYETLEPLEFLDNETVTGMVIKWTDEYLASGSGDIVAFFETKVKQIKFREGGRKENL